MTVTVSVVIKEGQLQFLAPVSLPEGEPIQAIFTYGSPEVVNPMDRTIEERVRGIEELSAHYRTLDLPALPDEAFERASFYEE